MLIKDNSKIGIFNLYPLFLLNKYSKRLRLKANNDNRAVAVAPRKLRHILKIHTVPARNKIKRQKHGGNDSKHFHQIVLLNFKLRLICFTHLAYDILQITNGIKIAVCSCADNRNLLSVGFESKSLSFALISSKIISSWR